MVLRGIIFSTNPPIVSRPSDSGNTSSNSMSESGLLPTNTSACNAAPSATTRSGSIEVSGSFSKKPSTWLRTSGMRVEPPTITTCSTSSFSMPASFTARRHERSVFLTSGIASSSKVSRVTSTVCFCSSNSSTTFTFAYWLSASLHAFALLMNKRKTEGDNDDTPVCCLK